MELPGESLFQNTRLKFRECNSNGDALQWLQCEGVLSRDLRESVSLRDLNIDIHGDF